MDGDKTTSILNLPTTGDATSSERKTKKITNDALPTNQFVRYAGKYAERLFRTQF